MKIKSRDSRNGTFVLPLPFVGCLMACVSLAQATGLESKLVYADKPFDIFIDVVNARNFAMAKTAVARVGDLALSQKGLLFSLSRRTALNLTNQFHWSTLPFSSIDASANNWRMANPKERMGWLLCQVFELDEGKYQGLQNGFDVARRFMVIEEDSIDALDVLSRQKEENRVKNIIEKMKDMSIKELQALAGNERSSKVLGILATNANAGIRLAVAKNGEAPFPLLDSMSNDVDLTVAEAAEKNLISARCPHFGSSIHTLSGLVQDIVFVKDAQQADDVELRIHKLTLNDREDLLQWLASRLCDLRFAPALEMNAHSASHDLSLIGGKCAYLLEKILGEKLVPVRRDTPLGTLEKQRERLMKRVQDMQ